MEDQCGVLDIVRKPKIFDMSIFDWVTSLLGAWIVGRFLLHISGVAMWIFFILLWVMFGVLVHWVLGVDTMLGYYLGISNKPQRKQC